MKNIRAVVFDCDGVMFDSQQANLAFYNSILQHFGVAEVTDAEPEKVVLCHTAASPQVFHSLLGEKLGRDAITYSRQVNYADFIPQLRIESGLAELLEELSQSVRLAVATNRGSSMVQILDHFSLADFFDAVLTYLDVERPKPAPDMLLAVARRFNLNPQQILFVGDSELDRLAALEAGCPFISYKWDGGIRIDHHRELGDLFR